MENVIRLTRLPIAVTPHDHVIKAADMAELQSAHDLIASAEQEADDILAGARDAFEQERQRGYQQGVEEARIEAARAIAADHVTLDRALSNHEAKLARIVEETVRSLLGDIPDDKLLRATLRQALETVRGQQSLRLRVNPSRAEAARQQIDAVLPEYPELEVIDLVKDPALGAHDLVLESELGLVRLVLDDTLRDLGQLLSAGST